MRIELKEFIPNKISRDEWTKFHQYRRKFFEQNTPDQYFIEDEMIENSIITDCNSEERVVRYFFIYSENLLIGRFLIGFYKENSPSFKQNEHVINF